jgi:uncharacterized membrane protein YgcG
MRPPTNLKVLTPDTYEDVMFGMQTALGVRCDFCHNTSDYASDEKRPKATARMMMQMVKDINNNHFNGRERVSCYTCHHGENRPAQAPGTAGPGGRGPGGFSGGRGGFGSGGGGAQSAPPAGPGR